MSELSTIEVAVSPVEKFREYLATKRQRLTQERALIVEEVFSSHEHFDADQLIEQVTSRKDGNRVSRSTVYRTLSALEEAGLIRKVAHINDRKVYEHDYGYPQHDHLICKQCGELTEFENDAISRLLEQIASTHGFRMRSHRLEVSGICRSCSRPPQRRHSKLDRI
ncbi:MAG: transcriptional repressor [Planctomycetes bacterium]|nr:transcriptional repressor [Planctomycetota bacterium]